ncbi:MAG: phosphoribosylformylglycinamidine synthase subunit PurQ [Planctomycetota bacterium]|jgi:phosphoribosylformylglycinamidine synthase
MTSTPHTLVLRSPGTNADVELARAFELAGATTEFMHVDTLVGQPESLERFQIIAFPGGFSYGDDIASGRVFAMRLREKLLPELRAAAARDVMMLGVCNGFQILVQSGLLPYPASSDATPSVALTDNTNARYTDIWVPFTPEPDSACLWTQNLWEGDPSDLEEVMRYPIAHAEGCFVADDSTLDALEASRQVGARYLENPNGSSRNIMGICDPSGRIFGLMPHPERYTDWHMHPFATRLTDSITAHPTPGMKLFVNAIESIQAGTMHAT